MDTRDTRLQNLFFLLSAAPLGMGCIITGGDDTDTEASPTTTDTPSTTTETPGTETTPGETTIGATTEEPVSTDDRAETTETPAETTMVAEDTTAGVDVPEVCVPYGAAIEACFAGYGETAVEECAQLHLDYAAYGDACVAALEDYIVCLTALSCEDLEMDPTTVCVPEQDALGMVCVKM